MDGRALEKTAVVKIESAALSGVRRKLEERGYTEVMVPHLTLATGACENFDSLFSTTFFGETAYLSQTGQLYLEQFVPTLGKVYCIGPSFRAEDQVDDRHLVEFTLIEIELPCDLKQLQTEIEQIISAAVRSVIDTAPGALDALGVDVQQLQDRSKTPFSVVTYKNAIEHLGLRWGDDLKNHHEKKLIEIFEGRPLFVTHFPEEIKFFNMKETRDDLRTVNSMDLLLPFGGEAVGAAEREEDSGRLEGRLRRSDMLNMIVRRKVDVEGVWKGLKPSAQRMKAVDLFRWYLDFVKERPVKHAGCGIGGTRLMQFILGAGDIRHATSYPINRETIL